MKWYQHSTDSHDDPDIADALDEFGDAGYSVFFIILEIYGREFNHLNDGWLTVSQTFLRRKLRKSWTKAEQILNFYQTKNRIFYETDGNEVRINVPNFIDKASNWTKRPKQDKRASPTEAPTEAPTAREEEEEEEEEKKKKELLTIPDFIDPNIWKAFKDHRRKMRLVMTPRAEQIIINKLIGFHEDGDDPNASLDEAIEKSWRSVFAPKKQGLSEGDKIRQG